MGTRLSVTTHVLVFATSVFAVTFFAGCQRKVKQNGSISESQIGSTLSVDPNIVLSDYALAAVEATGGHKAWEQTDKLAFGCIVTVYQPDGSIYLTEQRFEIWPWSNAIRISGREPEGNFTWQLSGDKFRVKKGPAGSGFLSPEVDKRRYAEAILQITTGPLRLLDKSAVISQKKEPIKIKGRRYQIITRSAGTKSFLYQDRGNSLINMIRYAGDSGSPLAVRGYDYKEVEKDGILAPTRIEIFRTDASGDLKERLIKVDLD